MARVTSRREARLVICPVCFAFPGEPCRTVKPGQLAWEEQGDERAACHVERHERAIEFGARVIPPRRPTRAFDGQRSGGQAA